MQTNYLPAMVAAVISLVMHGFLLAILWMVPSPLPEDPVSDAGLEMVVAQKKEEKLPDFF